MDEVEVVTVFLRNGADVLLLRRSDAVGSDAGRWGAVAGHAEGDPDAAARREIDEETDLGDQVTLVRRGEPFPVEDAVEQSSTSPPSQARGDAVEHGSTSPRSPPTHEDKGRGTRWVVHPYLFDCDARDVTPNEETDAWEWVQPTAIRERETVPELWTSWERVAPAVETVATDSDHGSAWLSLRALEALRDRAATAGEYDEVAATARALLDARPSMQVVANRVNRAMAGGGARTPDAVAESARAALDDAVEADAAAAATAADRLSGHVLTLSRSGTVADALERADLDRVTVLESRPAREGVGVAEELADEGIEVTLAVDAAAAHLLAEGDVDAVLVGADAVLRDGRVVNKVGTRGVAIAATRDGVPVHVACAREKVKSGGDRGGELELESGDPAAVYDGEADLAVENPTFDVTPADCVTGVATEDGVLDADGVAAVADELASLADWES